MLLTIENLEKITNFIEDQLGDEVFGLFDEETPILSAVENSIEHLKQADKGGA